MVHAETYEQLALAEPEALWELDHGRPRRKPTDMTFEHSLAQHQLASELFRQLDPRQFMVRINSARAERPTESVYIPDVLVVPVSMVIEGLGHETPRLEIYRGPLPLVVEVWSPSTGAYDVDTKLPEYQQRVDLEIWRVHPYERAVTIWHHRPDGTYTQTIVREGVVELTALPGVSIDIAKLFGISDR